MARELRADIEDRGRSLGLSRMYGGKTEGERRAERRERLLDAGLELFGTSGYAATTIETLCAQAHLNARYFYAEFRTKEALLKAVYDRHVETVFEQVRTALDRPPRVKQADGRVPRPGTRERLTSGLRAFIRETLADERAARINYFEIVGVSPDLEAHRRAVLRRYAELVTDEIRRGWRGTETARTIALVAELFADGTTEAAEIPQGSMLHMAAVALVSATDGLIIDALTSPDPVDPEAIVQALVALFTGAIA